LNRIGLGLLFLVGELLVYAAQGAPRHKIQVNDPAMERQIVAQGATLVADYGSFRVYDSPTVPSGVEVRDEYNRILLNAGPLDSSQPSMQALRRPMAPFSGRRLHLVHFAGPVKPEWRHALEELGARIVNYIPQNSYLIYGDATALTKVQAMAASAPHVQWEGSYADAYKVQPGARLRPLGKDQFSIQLVADAAANAPTLQLLKTLSLDGIVRQRRVLDYVNTIVRLDSARLDKIAAQPDVIAILPWSPPRKVCERQDQILAGNLSGINPSGPGYLAWLSNKGFAQSQFDASGFAVDITDSGIDDGTPIPNHFGLYTGGSLAGDSRVIYNRLEGTPNSGSTLAGCDGHGTINAHIVAGYDDYNGFPFADGAGYHFGLGVCPFVRVGSSVVFDAESWTYPDFGALQSEAYQDGVRISNNSWGDDADRGGYDTDSQEFDALVRDAQPASSLYPTPGNQEMVIVFSAGNIDDTATIIDQPGGTAKNTISVGAAQSVQPFNDGSTDDSQAIDANQIANFSDTGPCTDGRQKPDLVAPGSHVSGGVPQAASPSSNGTADPCFFTYLAEGYSGVNGTGNGPFFPEGDTQEFYDASDGTSHAAPAVCGACALLRQYFINEGLTPPSPAMTKAFLMNSARYLTGATANDTLWSPKQGMGEVDLGAAFDGSPRILRDELADDLFTASGQTRIFHATVANTNAPLLVTVAWTDAPGNVTGAAYNNDLDLTVNAGGQLYKGNVFKGRWSTNGGSADLRNNVESVFLPPGVSGPVTVTITAASINSIGVPNVNNALEQDFALVVDNVVAAGPATIVPGVASVIAESCAPTNGVISPGETVTVNLGLRNIGLVDTTNLVATLLAAGGVNAPSAAQNYGALAVEGAPASRSFSFTASGVCGSNLVAMLQLTDGSENLGSVTFSFPLCQPAADLVENFDTTMLPNLPADWETDVVGGQVPWITESNLSDSIPNAAFAAAATNIGISELLSPVTLIQTGAAQLVFDHQFDLELDPSDATLAYDGGVLEISVGGSNFVDILAAGGSFATNGYNTTFAPSSVDNNPLPGRRAWSGTSSGFISTVVNLPAGAAGQPIQLKWRCATDFGNAYGSIGWWVDDIAIYDGYQSVSCNGNVAPLILNPAIIDGRFVFSFQTSSNQIYAVQYTPSLTNAVWTSLPAITGDGSIKIVTNAPVPGQRYYRISSR
jgi:hypothetical protein